MDKMRDASELTISRLPQGGYVVTGPRRMAEFSQSLFASRHIGEALNFIAEEMKPGSEPSNEADAPDDTPLWRR